VSIGCSRRETGRDARMPRERARHRSDEGARHRRQTRDRSGEVAAGKFAPFGIAHASRVLVSASRRNDLSLNFHRIQGSGTPNESSRWRGGNRQHARRVRYPRLKRFVWFAHITRPSFEASELLEERELNFAHRSVPLLRDDQFGLASFFHTRLFVFLVEFWPDKQGDYLRVLLTRTRLAQIAEARFAPRAAPA